MKTNDRKSKHNKETTQTGDTQAELHAAQANTRQQKSLTHDVRDRHTDGHSPKHRNTHA